MIEDIERTIDLILGGVLKGRKTSHKEVWELLSSTLQIFNTLLCA